MLEVAWFTSARDKAAIELFYEVIKKIDSGYLPLRIKFIFINADPLESIWTKQLFSLAGDIDIPIYSLSSRTYKRDLRKHDIERWRDSFDRKVLSIISREKFEFVFLAGYMLILSPLLCNQLTIYNLHPALPGGPKGTWEEVINILIEQGASETGAQIHLVTPELDAGPPLTYFSFSLKDSPFDVLWKTYKNAQDVNSRKEAHLALFRAIREAELKREFPLIVETLRLLGEKRLTFKAGIANLDSTPFPRGVCLNDQIEARLR